MLVREMTRRCMYDPTRISWLKTLIQEKKHWGTNKTTAADLKVISLWKHYQESGFLSARILDDLNPDNGGHVNMEVISELLESLPQKSFKILSIHDCFRCHPNYANDLRWQYNNQLHLLARSNMLGNLLTQILNRPITTGKADPDMFKDVLAANYALS